MFGVVTGVVNGVVTGEVNDTPWYILQVMQVNNQ